MKVLVTGSNGRIGSYLIHLLLERGDQVCGLDQHHCDFSATDYEAVVGILHDEATVRRALRGVDAVVHLAAVMSWSPQDETHMFQTNVEGTRILLEASTKAGVSKFLFASSGEVYPENAPEQLPITEEHPRMANTPYGVTKLLGEELVLYYQRTKRLNTTILRFSHTQSARELLDENSFFSGPRFFLQPRINQQEKFGNSENANILRLADPGTPAHVLVCNEDGRPYQMHITDTRDMCQGLLLALDRNTAANKIYNLGSTTPVNFEQLINKMSTITGYPVVTVNLPGKGVFYQTDNQKIRTELGFDPQWPMSDMLAEAAQFWASRVHND